MLALTTWSYTDGAILAAALLTLCAGALIGRWWAIAFALIPALYMIAGCLLAGAGTDADGWTGLMWAAYIGVIASVAVALLVIGVAINRGIAWIIRRRQISQAAGAAGPAKSAY